MPDMEYNLDEELRNKIIAAAYEDAGLVDRLKIYFLTKKDAEAKRIFNEYKATAESIKSIKLEECPDSVIESVKIQTTKEKKLFIQKPAFAVSLLVLIITVAVLMFQSKKEEPVYTKAEIELAEEQVKASLAIVNKVFKKTENLIQEEVLPKRVGKPIHKSLTIINEVLIGG
jgi:hypothetical protein